MSKRTRKMKRRKKAKWVTRLCGEISPTEILIDSIFIDGEEYLRYYHNLTIPTRYFVSSSGNVYSETSNLVMHPRPNWKGYMVINISIGRKVVKPITVHKMVGLTWLKDQWKPGYTIDHIDGIKDHNDASNLEWVTLSENIQRAYRTGLKHALRGDASGAKYPDAKLAEALQHLENGGSINDAVKISGIPKSYLYTIIRGESRIDLVSKYNLPDSMYTHRRLPDGFKQQVLDLYQQGFRQCEIADQLGLFDHSPRMRVYRIVSQENRAQRLSKGYGDGGKTTPE